MTTSATVAYLLCTLVSAACAALLFRSWSRSRSRLTLWIAVAFVFLAVSNALLVADLFVATDLSIPRAALIAIGLGVLLYGLVLEDTH